MQWRNMLKVNKSLLCFIVLLLAFTSCQVTKPHKLPDMMTNEKLFRDLAVTDSSNMAEVSWKSLFTDPNLQSLITEAIRNNPDLQIAVIRMEKAEASVKQSRAAFFPSLSGNFDALLRNKNTDGSGISENYELYGSTSWEADIWGKLRSTKRANMASFLQSEAYKRAVQTQLIADVALNYYTLLAYDSQLQITRMTLEKREADVEAMQLLKDNDVITGADLVLSQANRYSAEVTIPDIEQAIYETENTLSYLLGRTPGPIDRGALAEQEISVELKSGIPAQLLANRPDVQQAEYQFRYFYEMTNVARSYFYPALTITATGGISETDLSQLFDAHTIIWNVAGGLVQPIFNQGVNKQRLRIARANEEEYFLAYKQTLISAGNEVVNAMHQYQSATDKIAIRTQQIAYLEKSVDFTMELLKYSSSTNYTDVLTSEVNLLSAQISSVNDKLQQLKATVYLYQSLGGGWK